MNCQSFCPAQVAGKKILVVRVALVTAGSFDAAMQ
jgi:hypothetical protein